MFRRSPRFERVQWVVALLSIASAHGCGGKLAFEAESSDGGDAGSRKDAAADAITDAMVAVDACTCSSPMGRAATTSLPCFCAMMGGCPTFDEAISCGGSVRTDRFVGKYTTCNVVEVGTLGTLDSISHIYDVKTHQLLGARVGSDVPAIACGSGSYYQVQAGIDPLQIGCDNPVRSQLCP